LLLNRAALYRLLFKAANRALARVAREAYGAKPGWVIVLHTWGQAMNLHVHVHIVLTCGGLSLDESSWIDFDPEGKRFQDPPLAEEFRKLYLRGLKNLLRKQELIFPKDLSWIHEEEELDRWLAPISNIRWHVHCQGAPPENPLVTDGRTNDSSVKGPPRRSSTSLAMIGASQRPSSSSS
jgi:hypothetical protein